MPDTICTNCNATVPAGQAFCSTCGTPVAAAQPTPRPMPQPMPQPMPAAAPAAPQAYEAPRQAHMRPAAQPVPAAAPPPAVSKPPKGSPYAVVGMWAFVGYSIVMALPIVGLIMAIVWAVSSSGPLNRRNYARALLVMWVLALAVTIVCTVLFWSALSQVVNIQATF